MDRPLEITFRNLDRSDSLVAVIEEKFGHLERFYHHMIGTHVKVELPHKHHRQGKHYQVTIEVQVPGRRLVASHTSDKRTRTELPAAAVNDAFKAITRKLEDYARKQRGDMKHHEAPLAGHIVRLYPDYGFVRLADEREIYFHKNSVVGEEFERLEEGAPVRLAMSESESAEGPQATTVEVTSGMQPVDERAAPYKTIA